MTNAPYLATTEVFPEDSEQLLIKLTDVYTKIANSSNLKDIGIYDNLEMLNGQTFFNPNSIQNKRYAYRQTFSFSAIAPGAALLIPHNINYLTTFTRIYGVCEVVKGVTFWQPLPFTSATGLITDQIQIHCTSVNIVITNGATAPAIVKGIVIVEYLKN